MTEQESRLIRLDFRRFLIPLLLWFFSCSFLSALESPGLPRVLEITRPSVQGQDPHDIHGVIAQAVKVELQRASLAVMTAEELDRRDFTEPEQVLKAGAELEADFTFLALYSVKENQISIDFAWYDVHEVEKIASLTAQGSLDLNLDALVAGAIRRLLANDRDRLASYGGGPAAAAPGTGEAAAAGPAASAPASTAATSPAATSPASSAVSAGPGAVQEPAPGSAPQGSRAERRRWEVSAGFGALVSTGKASDYFKIGYAPATYINYRFHLPQGQFGVGLYTGMGLFRAQGIGTAAQSYLIPAGVDLRYLSDDRQFLSVFVHLSGGPALLTIDPDNSAPLSKIILYTLGGLGIRLGISETLGLAAETGYSVYFEGSDPIMGFTPMIYLSLRL